MADPYRRVMQGTQLGIESHAQGERWVVEVRGEVNQSTVKTLEDELNRLSGMTIVLDLSQVDFIDSTGLALLLRTAGRLTIGAVSVAVERVLRSSGMARELRYGY